MLATGTYKVWALDPEADAPDPTSEETGIMIVANNDDGSRSRYWIETNGSATFPFVADRGNSYWFRRQDTPVGKTKSIAEVTLNTDQPPVTHEWEPWHIDNDGTVLVATAQDQSNGDFKMTVSTSLAFPLVVSSDIWVGLKPVQDHSEITQPNTILIS